METGLYIALGSAILSSLTIGFGVGYLVATNKLSPKCQSIKHIDTEDTWTTEPGPR